MDDSDAGFGSARENVVQPLAYHALGGKSPADFPGNVSAEGCGFGTEPPGGEGVGALAQQWRGENNYVFPPVTELPRIAQLLYEQPSAAATVVAPYWPTQAWFQQLSELATVVEVRALSDLARPPPQLHASARHALSGATLTIFRVPGRLGI